MSNLRFAHIDDNTVTNKEVLWYIYAHGQIERMLHFDLVCKYRGRLPLQDGVYHCGFKVDGEVHGCKLYLWHVHNGYGYGIMLRRGLIIRNGDRHATKFATLQLQRKPFHI